MRTWIVAKAIPSLGVVAICCLLSHPAVAANDEDTRLEEQEASDLSYVLGMTTWISEGQTEWSHDASSVNAALGNPTSELVYKRVRSKVFELNGKIVTPNRFFVRGQFGYGIIDDGTVVDDDFLSAAGAAANGTSVSGPHMFSRTESAINDNYLWFVTLDAGMPLFSLFSERLTVGVFGGYQHWRERVTAQGVTQITCTAVGTLCATPGSTSFSGQDAITNTVQWDSFRIGFDSEVRIFERLDLTATVAFVPYTILENQDTHHLRTDLRHDPSFSMTGTGHGYQAEAGLRFMLLQSLYLNAGIRYWRLEVTDGEWQNHPIGSASSTVNLNEFSSERYGGTFGISYSF